MRQKIYNEVVSIAPLDDTERVQINEVCDWIQSDAELFRRVKPATPNKHLVSYFVVVDGQHVLLVDHKNAQLWLPTGGHVEVGEHPRDTVVREAYEELGITVSDDLGGPLFLTSSMTVGLTAGHTDVSLWYVLYGDRTETFRYDEEEFHSIKWFSFSDVPLERCDPNMGRFLRKLVLASRDSGTESAELLD